METIKVKILDSRAKIPQYATSGSSGFDFYCETDTPIPSNTWRMVVTGLCFQIPDGYEIQIRSRSGAALEHGLIVLNQPGTIDSDYRGPISIMIWNITNKSVIIEAGSRIAQGVLCPVIRANFEEVESLEDTDRGSGGFGSTGLK